MKRKLTINLIIFLIGLTSLIIISQSHKELNETNKEKSSSFISMMVENEEGKYTEKSEQQFVKDDYIFNSEKSGCENGGTLAWNSEKQKIEASLITSDKCYAYFDKYDFTKSCLYGYENNMACDIVKKNEDTLIYHNGTIKSSDIIIDAQDYSYRYSGASGIVNNYVCLGTDNNAKGECANNDLYRIIGLFKNDKGHYEIKLIKDTPYEDEDAEIEGQTPSGKGYRWSGLMSSNYKNTWKDSTLNTVTLNQNYLNSLPSYVQDNIMKHTYITGGNIFDNIQKKYVYETYQNEIKNPYLGNIATEEDKTYDGKVALMYVSDYGYGAYKDGWTMRTLENYLNENIQKNNWLYINDGNTYEWLLLRSSEGRDNAFSILNVGSVVTRNVNNIIYAIRPVFYLSYNTILKSGNGTKLAPFRIA